jgi:hypothetical protein
MSSIYIFSLSGCVYLTASCMIYFSSVYFGMRTSFTLQASLPPAQPLMLPEEMEEGGLLWQATASINEARMQCFHVSCRAHLSILTWMPTVTSAQLVLPTEHRAGALSCSTYITGSLRQMEN